MSIAAQCSDCCTCPTATVQWESVSASRTKTGEAGYTSDATVRTSKRFLTRTVTGSMADSAGGGCSAASSATWAGSVTIDSFTGALSGDGTIDVGGLSCSLITYPNGFSVVVTSSTQGVALTPESASYADCADIALVVCSAGGVDFAYTSETSVSWTGFSDQSGTVSISLSDEYTTALLKTNTLAALPAWDDDWNDTAGSFANLSTDELSYAIRKSRYRLLFKIPQVRTGKCYRVDWVERFIAEAGVTISSVEVYARGVYRPTVTLSAPPAGGIQARAIAVMSSTGTVSSIRILNPGSGYTSAPTVTVQAATGGGTSSTGWTATLTGGQVTAISGGSAGDYRPTLAFSGGGGSGATATCTVDEMGGIDAVTLTATGSGYTSEPTLTITAKVSGATAADLLLHLGTETAKCVAWDGTVPSGYDPDTPSTYPILPSSGYYEVDVPTSDGTTLVANVRASCDCVSCP